MSRGGLAIDLVVALGTGLYFAYGRNFQLSHALMIALAFGALSYSARGSILRLAEDERRRRDARLAGLMFLRGAPSQNAGQEQQTMNDAAEADAGDQQDGPSGKRRTSEE
jgi:hypothetical protein